MKSKIKAVIFDCDGVMFDSSAANRAYYNAMLSHLNLPPMSDEQFRYVHMHTVLESMQFLFRNTKAFQKAVAFREKISYHEFIPLMEMEPGLISLLNYLKPAYLTAIATNRTDTMSSVIKTFGLEPYFDLVITAENVKRPKPAPDQLELIMGEFKITSEWMLFIGDSQLDMLAAVKASVPFAAYRNDTLGAAYHIYNLTELEKIV